MLIDIADERHVELHELRLELREAREPRVAGTEVVDKIRAARTGTKGGMENVPLDTITIQSASIVK